MMQKRFMFLAKFFTSPKAIGSITPSSSFLTKKMFQDVDWQKINTVIELGAGTGVFTEYLSKHLLPHTQVLIIEQDDHMRKKLQEKYSHFKFGKNAESLKILLTDLNFSQADFVVSGLPFTTLTSLQRNQILSSIVDSLRPGGTFVAFQYSLHMKKYFSAIFDTSCIRFALFNIPPAFVYVCRKKVGNCSDGL